MGSRGSVVLIFQPAEEGPGGALPMIEEGVLDEPPVDLVAMLHVDPRLDVGTIGVTPGPVNASADELYIDVKGVGGHGAYPHESVDALVAAAAIVLALQNVVAREVDPFGSAVVTIGTIEGGYRNNVIADEIKMSGTLRAHDPAIRDALEERVRRIVAGVAAAYRVQRERTRRAGLPSRRQRRRARGAVYRLRSRAKHDPRRAAAADDGCGRLRVLCKPPARAARSPRRSQRSGGRGASRAQLTLSNRRASVADRHRIARVIRALWIEFITIHIRMCIDS